MSIIVEQADIVIERVSENDFKVHFSGIDTVSIESDMAIGETLTVSIPSVLKQVHFDGKKSYCGIIEE